MVETFGVLLCFRADIRAYLRADFPQLLPHSQQGLTTERGRDESKASDTENSAAGAGNADFRGCDSRGGVRSARLEYAH